MMVMEMKVAMCIYQNINNDWVKIGDDIDGEAAGDESGFSVSLSSDGSIVAIGAYRTTVVALILVMYVFMKITMEPGHNGSDIDGEAAGDSLGYSVSISPDGTTVAVGAVFNDDNGSNMAMCVFMKITMEPGQKLVEI